MNLRSLFLLLLIVPLVVNADTYNCDSGCSMDPDVMGPRVCGDDGFTYVNECVAYCQVSLWKPERRVLDYIE
jgi:hypothetical protein